MLYTAVNYAKQNAGISDSFYSHVLLTVNSSDELSYSSIWLLVVNTIYRERQNHVYHRRLAADAEPIKIYVVQDGNI